MSRLPHASAVNIPYTEGQNQKLVLRRVKPDGVELFYALPDDVGQAIEEARELWEWSFTKSELYVQCWHQDREHPFPWWEVHLIA